jgi:hypothetical protein
MKARGTYVEGELVQSAAFQNLSGAAIKVFMGFRLRVQKRRRKRRSGAPVYEAQNDRELVYTYDQMQAEWGIRSRATVARVIDELVDHGFLDIVRTGQGRYKVTTIYGLGERWRAWDPDPTVRQAKGWNAQPRKRNPRHPGFGREAGNGQAHGLSQVQKPEPAKGSASSET